jgi:hypothetical protein
VPKGDSPRQITTIDDVSDEKDTGCKSSCPRILVHHEVRDGAGKVGSRWSRQKLIWRKALGDSMRVVKELGGKLEEVKEEDRVYRKWVQEMKGDLE